MKIYAFVGGICLAAGIVTLAQDALTNDSIEKMAKAGLGDDVIVAMIQSRPGQYDVTPDTLITLKTEGLSNKVLAAMAAKTGGAGTQSAAPTDSPSTATGTYEDLDIGVYRRLRNMWISVAPELVNWKTGGWVKRTASLGVVKEDVNGHINGTTSATQVGTPVQFLIKTPEGVEAMEFQLVRLHPNSSAREFRTVTGGVFHESGGSTRDAIPFEQTKVSKQTYKIVISTSLAEGEYAFLAPGFSASTSSGSTGKAYTFRVVE